MLCDGCVALAIASFLPGIDQVLSQADTGMGASDGDLSVSWAFHRVGNLDLSPWHLTNLIDLCALTANDAANELRKNKKTWGKHQHVFYFTNETMQTKKLVYLNKASWIFANNKQ